MTWATQLVSETRSGLLITGSALSFLIGVLPASFLVLDVEVTSSVVEGCARLNDVASRRCKARV
jgi:hypothetical protein